MLAVQVGGRAMTCACLLADVMYKLGAHTVLAVDVGAQDEQNFYNFGDQLSGTDGACVCASSCCAASAVSF